MNEYYANLPKKRMAAGALLLDSRKKILLVKTSYKDYWSIPGGVIERDESPLQALKSELREEVNLVDYDLKFLSVDYYANRNNEKGESIQFLFGGVLKEKEIRMIKVDGKEILEACFFEMDKIYDMLSEETFRRIKTNFELIKNDISGYLEEGTFIE